MRKLFFEHPRLWISVIAGGATFFLLPGQWTILSRVLVCWNAGVILFLVLIFLWMTSLSAVQICSKYVEEDASGPIILVIVTVAAMLSLVAIVEPLATIKQVTGLVRAAHFALAALTLINSWILVPTMFTTHYADLYYRAKDDARPLHFPQSPMPVFWDFAYFSFTIAAACQTADVATANTSIRKTVLAHSIIAFVFNASILGFAVNISAGLFSG